MFKIAHIADIHIMSYSRHQEYKEYFEELYKSLKSQCVDIIFIGGDWAHSKTNLSPDFYDLSFKVIKKLSEIAKIIIIPGNHDLSEKNLSRLDALSPIIDNIKKDEKNEYSIFYLKKSEDLKIWKQGRYFSFRSFSLLDKENWNFKRGNLSDFWIALYHGAILGSETDLGFIFEDGIESSQFQEFDLVLCGDIHKQQYFKDILGGYSGNPWQHNFGDGLKKGYLLWNIRDRDNIIKEFIELPNLYPFVSLKINDEIPILKDSKAIRLKIKTNESFDESNEYINKVKEIYKDKLISFVKIKEINKSFEKNNKRNQITFENYIKFNKNKNELIEIHNQYLSKISNLNNINNWNIRKIKWNNLFSYAENNEIIFEDSNGKVLLFEGKNFSGKTSLYDIICFSLFGKWTKDFIKVVNFINDNKQYADCEIEFSVNEQIYSIYRRLERKKNDCKSIMDFKIYKDNKWCNINFDDKLKTQNEINKLIGSYDEFCLTSLSTQFNNFSLLSEKSTKRKEYFCKFLGIHQYEEIFSIAKSDLQKIEQEIEIIQKYENIYEKYSKLKVILPQKLEELSNLVVIDFNKTEEYNNLLQEKSLKEEEYNNIIAKELEYNILISQYQNNIQNIEKYNKQINNNKIIDIEFNLDQHKSALLNLKEIENLIYQNNLKIQKTNSLISKIQESEELLKSVPCEDKFPDCKFLLNSNKILKNKEQIYSDLLEQTNQNTFLQNELSVLKKYIHESMEKEKIYNNNILLDKINKSIIKEIEILEEENIILKNKINVYVKKDSSFKDEFSSLENEINILKKEKDESSILIKTLEMEIKFLVEQRNDLENKISNINKLSKNIDILKQYVEIVGKKGIINEILNDNILFITDLINDILSNIRDISIRIQIDDDKSLEIYFKDDKSERLIESCSGYEHSIMTIALRMALLQYSQINCSNLLMLDEPGTAIEAENIIDLIKLIEICKSYEKTILLTTHISALKECSDVIYKIDKSSGYSKIIS